MRVLLQFLHHFSLVVILPPLKVLLLVLQPVFPAGFHNIIAVIVYIIAGAIDFTHLLILIVLLILQAALGIRYGDIENK